MKRRTKKKIKYITRAIVAILFSPLVLLVMPFYWMKRKLKRKPTSQAKFQDIVSGFSHMVVKDTAIEKMAKARAAICSTCPLAMYNGKLNTIMVGDDVHQIKGMYCDGCGCALAAKVRSENDTCPQKKW